MNKDTAYYHKPSKTVIGADLLFNNPPTEQVRSRVPNFTRSLPVLTIVDHAVQFSKSTESPHSLLFSRMNPTGWQQRLFIWSKQENKE